MISGKQTRDNHSRNHQQGRGFDYYSTAAHRIKPKKGQHGCIVALLPPGKLSGASRKEKGKNVINKQQL